MSGLSLLIAVIVSFAWAPNSESDLAGYRLYRITPDNHIHRVIEIPARPNMEEDSQVKVDIPKKILSTNEFCLTAFDTEGFESDYSERYPCDSECRKKYLAPKKLIGIGLEP